MDGTDNDGGMAMPPADDTQEGEKETEGGSEAM